MNHIKTSLIALALGATVLSGCGTREIYHYPTGSAPVTRPYNRYNRYPTTRPTMRSGLNMFRLAPAASPYKTKKPSIYSRVKERFSTRRSKR